MQAIIYTPEHLIENETDILSDLLDAGADYLYIRKPELDDFSLVDFVESIPERYWEKCISTSLIITKEFSLGGYHFTREMIKNNAAYNNKALDWLRENGKRSSVSAHDLNEVKVFSGGFDHILVCPVFESISKEGHSYNWDLQALENILYTLHSPSPEDMSVQRKSHFFAIGGVDVGKISEIKRLHFYGFGLLGALWKEPEKAVEKFKEMLRQDQHDKKEE